jgi:spore germination protein
MFKQLFGRRNRTPQVHNQSNTSSSDSSKPLSTSLQENLTTSQTIRHHPSDLLIRHFTIGTNQYPCALVSIDGLVDIAMINEQLLSPMLHSFDHPVSSSSELIHVLKQQILTL